jgi:predicted nucleotidyltransferase
MMETAKVRIETARGTVELEFKDLQEAMERMGAANLETLRQWVQSLERRAMAANQRE